MHTQLSSDHILDHGYRGRLTEGLVYEPRNNSVLWVDIIQAQIHRHFLDTNVHEQLALEKPGESIGAIGRTADVNKVLACTKSGVAVADFTTKTFTSLVQYDLSPAELARLRSNDGIVDPWGNLLIGLMNDFPVCDATGPQPEGYLLKVSTDLSIEKVLDKTIIANGLGFSSDRKRFYWIDSMTHTVWSFDVVDGRFTNRQKFIDIKSVFGEFESPEPDGMCITADDEFYVAVFSTSTVAHFNAKGELVRKFKIPAERITCCIIGGKNSDELFVTTGHLELGDPSADIKLDETGDLGGYIFRYQLDKPVSIEPKNVWGGQL